MAQHAPTPKPSTEPPAGASQTQADSAQKPTKANSLPPAGHRAKLLLSPSGETYLSLSQAENPYARRTVASSPPSKLAQPARTAIWRHAQSAYAPQVQPASRPGKKENSPPPKTKSHLLAALPLPERLEGNALLLPLWVERFFALVLQELRRDPWCFDALVEELMALLAREALQTPLHRSHLSLQSWEDLLSTLQEVSRYPAAETFTLFCSALLAYYALVHPEKLVAALKPSP